MLEHILITIVSSWLAVDCGTVPTTNVSLSCYDCSESFKYVWEPYTECQYYPHNAPVRACLEEEMYCKVERVAYKEMTVSITRGCAKECWHGCYASGFGLTRLKCTSCCMDAECNIGGDANHVTFARGLMISTILMHINCFT